MHCKSFDFTDPCQNETVEGYTPAVADSASFTWTCTGGQSVQLIGSSRLRMQLSRRADVTNSVRIMIFFFCFEASLHLQTILDVKHIESKSGETSKPPNERLQRI